LAAVLAIDVGCIEQLIPVPMALSITFRDCSRSVNTPKLLQPSPTRETESPELPRLRFALIHLDAAATACHDPSFIV
jgi:hypothetical protein